MRILFTAISGTNTDNALSKISSSIQSDRPIQIFKFEDYLVRAHEEKMRALNFSEEKIVEEIERIERPGGIQILLQYPKNYIRGTWEIAFNTMREDTISFTDVFFSMHSIYYQTQNREFFTAYSSEMIKNWQIDKVITLVDDIYDSHARLRVEDGVLSDESRDLVYPEPHVRARSRINDLFTVLDWRSKEIIAAEQMASILGKKHYVIAVKHPISVVTSILLHDASIIYISHPITQVRRLKREGRNEEAEGIIKQISDLTDSLIDSYKEKVTAIFPTAIDELIIEKTESFPGCIPRLQERWPLIRDEEELIYCMPELLTNNPLDIEELYIDTDGKEKEDVSSDMLYSIGVLINDILKPAIANHIDSRDHFLVDQCRAICVYRPYFDGNFSTGVSEEVLHRTLRYKCRLDAEPKLCVIYCPPEDLAKVRLVELMLDIQEETRKEFSDEEREDIFRIAKNDSQTWYRLRKLKPEKWSDKEVKALFTKADVRVKPTGNIEKSALGKDTGRQFLDFDYMFWNRLAKSLSLHPLERNDALIKDVDIWIEDEISPQDLAKTVVKYIEGGGQRNDMQSDFAR